MVDSLKSSMILTENQSLLISNLSVVNICRVFFYIYIWRKTYILEELLFKYLKGIGSKKLVSLSYLFGVDSKQSRKLKGVNG